MLASAKSTLFLGGVLISCSSIASAAEKMTVVVVDRVDNRSNYSYVVPGFSTNNSSGTANCSGGAGYANCSGSGTTTGVHTPGFVGSYEVSGATLTLQLPDRRLVVVNCKSKMNWTEWDQGAYRSCRIPLVRSIQAEFKGDKAKLRWPVSIDGKKLETESYKILGILDPPESPVDPAPQ